MSLQSLPPELTERVVVLLDIPDISSLRLTNKCLASKTAQKYLKARFRTKTVELTEQRLCSFVAMTASGGLGCLLQDLTLVAQVYNPLELTTRLEEKDAKVAKLDDDGQFVGLGFRDLTEEELRQTRLDREVLQTRRAEQVDLQRHRRDVELLGQALANLAEHGASLRMLRTEVEIYKDDTTTPLLPLFGGDWKPIWAAAASVSHTLFAALAACDLPVQSLDLFNSSRMLRCSLSCNELNNVDFSSGGLGSSLGQLVKLSLSISEETTQESNCAGLRCLLRTCPNIRKLDLAHFSLDYVAYADTQCGRILTALGESSLPRLQDLSLQGFTITENELYTTLQGFRTLRSLLLRYIKLTNGTFKRILDYCTMEAAMEQLELDSLFQSRIVQFGPPWAVQKSGPDNLPVGYPRSCAFYWRSLDSAASSRIEHHMYQGHTLDSSSIKVWSQDLKNRFGPLPENGKPSCLQPYVHPEQTWRYR